MIHLVRRLEARNFTRPRHQGRAPRRWPLRVILACGTAYLFYLFIFSNQGLLHILSMRRDLAMLQRKADGVASHVKVAEEELVRVRTDPFYTEKYVRENTGLVKDGEIVYRVVPESTVQRALVAQQERALAHPIGPVSPGRH